MNVLSDLKVLKSHLFHYMRGVGFDQVYVVISKEDRGNGAVLPDDGWFLGVKELRHCDSVHWR